MARRRPALTLDVRERAPSAGDAPSFVADAARFAAANVVVSPGGVSVGGAPALAVDPAELQLGDVIGRGASSVVRRAVHTPTGRVVALKCISTFDRAKRAQLVAELNALFTTRCDALVSFGGAFVVEGDITVVLEHMDCGSLSDVLRRRGAWPERPLAGLAFQVLTALAYLRAERRLHRDVKPGNVLISSDGACKLSDFGLSTELVNSVGVAATLVGTCKWMAPERITGRGATFASDVWAAGLVLFEAATGAYPYDGSGGGGGGASTYIELAQTVCDAPPPTLPPSAAPGLATLLAACLHKAPGDRLPADVLLGAPWLRERGVTDLASARAAVREWVAEPGGGAG